MSRLPSDIRERAVRAAIDLAAEHGAAGVTFDAVAAAVGASKGAVLHHFRTKDALLAAAVEGIAVEYQDALAAAMGIDPNPMGSFCRTMLHHEMTDRMNRAVRGMLAVVLERPELITPLESFFTWCHDRIRNDGIDPVVASIVMSATDGFWLTGVIGLPSVPPELQAASHQWLADLIEREASVASTGRRAVSTP